jgi:AbrB family looped-hinge helix DNA binding protein
MKTVLVRSGGRIVVPKKIADDVGILEGTVLTFEDSKSKFSKKVVVQPSGRVVIPLEIRESFDIGDGTPLFLIVPANGTIMTVKTVSGEIFHISIS